MAKDCEATIKKRLRKQAKRKFEQAEKQRLLEEVADEFSGLTSQLRRGLVKHQLWFDHPMKLKRWLTFLLTILAIHIAARSGALPVTISFLDNEKALEQTTNFLAAQGIDVDSIDWFRRVVKWHNKTSLGLDLERFPTSDNGFYIFQSISNLTDSLPQPLIYARHQYDLNCFDNVILLAGTVMQTKLQPDDLSGPFLAEVATTNNFVVSMALEETPRDAFNVAYPLYAREATKLVFGGARKDKRICLTAALDSYCTLTHQTTENNLDEIKL